jgi:hypothetical protein
MDFLHQAIDQLSSTPQRSDELARGLSDTQLSWKPSPEVFSMRENILHLRDIDVEGYEKRLGLILSEMIPRLPDVDGSKLARERDYNTQSIRPALEDLRGSRAASMEKLKGCTDADLQRKAEMQGVGIIDLRRLLELWMEHDGGHLAAMIELRKAIDDGNSKPTFVEHQAA